MIRINVVGFKGGSGKSTIAYYMARQLTEYYNVALVDKTFSGTISRIYNINNNIFSFLKGRNEVFYINRNNLSVINMSFLSEDDLNGLDFNAFKYLYGKLIKDSDIVIVDHSSIPHDFATEIELKAFMENFRNFAYNTVLVLSGDEIPIKRYLNYTVLLNEFVKNYAENVLGISLPSSVKFLKIIAVIINKILKGQESRLEEFIKGDEILQRSARFVIPFYISLTQRHFKDIEPPKEINDIIRYILDFLREPTSIL
ncbi:ParA family protein [Sulfolobus sp. E5-1-F]|uniref:ParA family protein n=1 Tax=Saccharolobus sp. E5-1-F TaxID=2663019 RepID=UPI001296A298|nr:ParA family protein [Sulfolobus sp. E5-1-F]QGA53484.1 ParA family protein [Sulfolobus sp. E5-1-F]